MFGSCLGEKGGASKVTKNINRVRFNKIPICPIVTVIVQGSEVTQAVLVYRDRMLWDCC